MNEKIVNEISDASSPQVVEQFIGQDRVKQQVKVALEASWVDGARFPDTLVLGSAGLGKTEMSHLIAKEMGTVCKEALSTNFKNISDLNVYLMECQNGDCAFLDEIHELRKDLVVVLYRAMENKKIFVNGRSKKVPYTIPLNNFSLIAATTDYHKLPSPLRDRFRLTLYFEFYRDEDIELILKNRSKKLNWSCEERVFYLISQRTRGIPRVGLRILEASRRVSRSENSETITIRHLDKACNLEGLDSLGLNNTERQYLSILAEYDCPVRLNTLAMAMGNLSRNVSQVIEPYLFRSGLITKDDSGRIITPKGLEHIRSNPIVN